MSLYGKFARIVVILGLVISALVVWTYSYREFNRARADAVTTTQSVVRAHSTLPIHVYARSAAGMTAFIEEELRLETALYAAVFDGSGEVISANYRLGAPSGIVPELRALRSGVQPLELNVRVRQLVTSGEGDAGWFSRLLPGILGERVSDVSVPIVSSVNPLERPVTAAALIESWSSPQQVRSVFVVGYANVGISHASLWRQIQPGILLTLLVCALLVTLSGMICGRYARSLMSSFINMANQAHEEVTRNNIDINLRFPVTGEARDIATLLNMALEELKSYRAHLNIDRELLSLKVEEQGSKLTERDQQLDQARTEVSRTREDLHRMAYYDSLTGLPNRRLFTEQLSMMLKLHEREGKQLALMFLDLDKFKRINDSLGHSAGDLLLREVGIRLASCMRTSDLLGHFAHTHISVEVSRLGGDEFTLVLNDVRDPEEASVVAERVLKAIGEPMVIDNHELIITPSIGIAVGPRDANDVEGLLKAADTAMYQAKASGKNTHVFYSAEMKTSDVKRLKLETDLRRAVEREELVLHYQPMVSLRTGTVVGVEALVRWQHPERGLVGPDEFIPLAEEMGLIIDIGEWTLLEACRMIARLGDDKHSLSKVSVNVSPLAVAPSLVDRVKEIIASTGADPRLLELELTENVLMETHATPIEALHKLKEIGVSLSIDDFGTGYSSLSYLSHFPLDTLKIDRSFVQDFDKSENNESLVEAIAAMAVSLDLQVVAEGVETAEQLKFLRSLKVELIQGWLFSRAVTDRELPFLLKEGHFVGKIKKSLLAAPEGLTLSPA